MSNELECTFEEFKQRFNEFRLAEPGLNDDEIDNAFKMLSLSYLNMTEQMWQHSAAIVLQMASDIMLKRNIR
jgi:hypothetical protein